MGRVVTLVLVDRAGTVLGALPPYEVELPWWQDAAEIVAGAREHHGVAVTVLRLLHADQPAPPGGRLTYLAEADGDPGPVRPATAHLVPHPRRAPYAEIGGPAASLAWATAALAARGRTVTAAAQQRTWNLSAIWRLDTDTTPVWLKQVPHFFAHEAAVLGWLGEHCPGTAPVPIAADDGRVLLDDLPGTDRYGAPVDERQTMLSRLHTVQVNAARRVPELLALGVPDQRPPRLAERLRAVVARAGATAPAEQEGTIPAAGAGERLAALMDGLEDRLAEITACGLPDTLVHGDFHPGNVRGTADRLHLIDWGDSVLAHPAIDLLRMCEHVADPEPLRQAWGGRWRAAVPGCDPERAITLIEPLVALRNAAAYAGFLDAIEPSEWPYHADDVPYWLAQAAA
ncbi:phosphotransferase family protein [Catellatospora methionotrophica]|uniref:phosphotransferase family protein n=1 Tax=Catellatospora methionotrophica TaxID=121620 RepID=UPI00140A392A|nr:aminoglycoside phosphotransferase family protein [Catellatospora methionotrophica]